MSYTAATRGPRQIRQGDGEGRLVMRQKAKRDGNEAIIVSVLRGMGADVERLNGKALPDLLVGWRGYNILFEVKRDGGKLNPVQAQWHRQWRGQVAVIKSAAEAVALLEGLECARRQNGKF